MRVLLLPGDTTGCGFYRMTAPGRAVADAFPEIDVVVAYEINVEQEDDGRLAAVDAYDADVVVLQRPGGPNALEMLRVLQSQGVAVVVEVDDLLSGVPPAHGAYPILIQQGDADRVHQCAREADLVVVSTPALLAEYARHGRGVVVPNAIPRWLAELPPAYEREPSTVTIGWTGTVPSHPLDLLEMGSGLRQAMDRLGDTARFAVWADRGVAEQTGVTPHTFGWCAGVEAFVTAVGEQLAVGLAPLRNDRFNAAKSWLKPLEYAARGVLPIRSVVGEYERLGLGISARRPRDWAALVTRAARDTDWRREQAAAARERVLAGHLMEHTVERWAAAWRRAADIRARVAA